MKSGAQFKRTKKHDGRTNFIRKIYIVHGKSKNFKTTTKHKKEKKTNFV